MKCFNLTSSKNLPEVFFCYCHFIGSAHETRQCILKNITKAETSLLEQNFQGYFVEENDVAVDLAIFK